MEKAMLRAIRDHSMIQSGDRILIGASGGKDSLALRTGCPGYMRNGASPSGISVSGLTWIQ